MAESIKETGDTDYFGNELGPNVFKTYLIRCLRYWYLFVFFMALCLIGGYFFLSKSPEVYLTSATILVKESEKNLSSAEKDILAELSQVNGNNHVENEIVQLKSKPLFRKVIEQLNLTISYTSKDGLKPVDLYKKSPVNVIFKNVPYFKDNVSLIVHIKNDKYFSINEDTRLFKWGQSIRGTWGICKVEKVGASPYTDIYIQFHNIEELIDSMKARFSVKNSFEKSTALELNFEDTSRQRGEDVLSNLFNAHVEAFIFDKNQEADNTIKFIQERLRLLTDELKLVEKNVEDYKRSNGITDISTESELFLERIKENDAQRNEVQTQIKILNTIAKYMKNPGEEDMSSATYVLADPLLQSLLVKYGELNLQRKKAQVTISDSNPIITTIDSQLQTTRKSILQTVQSIQSSLALTKENLTATNEQLMAGIRSIPQKERQYVEIKRQQIIKENLYLYLLQKREEMALASASTVSDNRLIDPPYSSPIPISPKKASTWLGSILAGFLLPFILVNIILFFNDKVQSRKEVEQLAQVPIIGEIGHVKMERSVLREKAIIPTHNSVAEQIRALRTNLSYLADGKARIILITSSMSREGKSLVSINLAKTLSDVGKKVIVVGLDLRKPTLHILLGLNNQKGVSGYLIEQLEIEQMIQSAGEHKNFDIITSGPLTPNPSELLSNGRLNLLFNDLRRKYDYILLDTAPYGLVTDTSIIAPYCDATLFLVRFNYTTRQQVSRIRELHYQQRLPNIGIVLNDVPVHNFYEPYGQYGQYGDYEAKEKGHTFSKKWLQKIKDSEWPRASTPKKLSTATSLEANKESVTLITKDVILAEGMIVEGVVERIVPFGAYVKLENNKSGLIHLAHLADYYVKDPLEIVQIGQQVSVRVLEIDDSRKKIALSMKV
ncbi:polysaccharide biosynthesis tyrosine autokinase [Siphonobacter sp. SORGH_AS_1065]|uniref:polysaccharide biosynthesis tyrosine autokinase n=1 Tax=Siphonobacter sp. SORGH_AS_1065 TaxID=3041795 RepID=UPI0027885914|nr:polysaccharide biosynthesis tyrosine autokinase [Siphonobacter sp. SORGH_AS_1065]MDQ1085599.1 tyrosine-protein kinase Etk/Wzc [Siphonobacter sp. SORGH_AS_1065]